MRKTKLSKVCEHCNATFDTLEVRNKFCSRSCGATYNNLKRGFNPLKKCLGCKKHFQFREARSYCTSNCRFNHRIKLWLKNEYDPTTKQGLSQSFRAYLLEQANYKCEECSWSGFNPISGKSTLQVDHIDGCWYNNQRSNLKVLCPNCHSLTPNYGALNKGNGRSNRYVS